MSDKKSSCSEIVLPNYRHTTCVNMVHTYSRFDSRFSVYSASAEMQRVMNPAADGPSEEHVEHSV